MNNLTKYLVQNLLEEDSKKTVALYAGGFKPPTKGHFEVVKKALTENPNIDEFIIFIGSGIRDGIGQSESLQIWELYKKYLPFKVRLEPVKAPIKSVLNYAKENPTETILWVLGTREDNPEDWADLSSRTRSLDKYPNMQLRVIQTKGGVSGTAARKAIKTNSKEQFYNLIPDIKEKDQVWDLVSPIIAEVGEANLTPYKWTEVDREGRFIYIQFITDKGTEYEVDLENLEIDDPNDEDTSITSMSVEFMVKRKDDDEYSAKIVVNKGELYRVMATITAIIKKYIKKFKAEAIIYSPAKKASEEDFGTQRDNLYKAFISKAIPGVKFEQKRDMVIAILPSVKEASDPEAGTALPYGSGFAPVKEITNESKVICNNCGWEWKLADGGKDPYICHKCGNDNNPTDFTKLKQAFTSLAKYMIEQNMNIDPFPKIKFINDDKENASELLGKTAYYDPNNKEIVLYTLNRHPKDILRSFCHEIIHYIQDLEGRLNNITTTNTNEGGDLPEIEREAYEKGNMLFRNWEDKIKSTKYIKEYKQYVLTELFEKDLPNIKKISPTEYIVGNSDDIEAKYHFKFENWNDKYSVNWSFTDNNKNNSPEAWKQVTATSFKIIDDFIKNNNPKALYISGNTDSKTTLYKNYINKLETLLNNKYKIDNSSEDRVVLRSIEEISKPNIKKRMDTLNESYKQSLSYWQNGDLNSKSKIEHWNSIKKKIKREVLQELYNINIPAKNNFLDISKFNQPKTFIDKLNESLNEITLSKDNAVEINGDLTGGKFNVGDKIYEYSIKNILNPYKDLGTFYNIQFTPEENITSKPTKDTDPKDYIKILSTMYKIIVDFAEKEKPDYIGIASLDNVGDKNYHRIYATLTDNKYNNIPGYFRKDVNLGFNSEAGKGRMIVLKRKNV